MKLLKKYLAVLLAFAMILGSVSVAASAVDSESRFETPGTIDFILKAYRFNEETGKYDIETTRAKPGEEIQIRAYISTDFFFTSGKFITAFENDFFTSAYGTTIKVLRNGSTFDYNAAYSPSLDLSDNMFLNNFYKTSTTYRIYTNKWINSGLVEASFFDDIDLYSITYGFSSINGAQLMHSDDWTVAYNVIVRDDITETVNGNVVAKSGCDSGMVTVPSELLQPNNLRTGLNIDAPTYMGRGESQGSPISSEITNTFWDSTLTNTPAVVSIMSNVILDANSGVFNDSGDLSETKIVAGVIGEKVANIGAYIPEKEGFTFLGWSESPDEGATASPSILSAAELAALKYEYEDITLYAQWKKNIVNEVSYSYSVYFMGTDGTYSDPIVMTASDFPENTIKLSAFDIPGYQYDAERSNAQGVLDEEGNVSPELNLYYTRNQYKLTFHYEDMSGEQTETYNVRYESDVPDYETLSGISAPVKIGYSFIGWSQSPDEMIAAPQKMPMADLDLYAVYSPIEITYLFDAGSGEFEDGTQLKSLVFGYGEDPQAAVTSLIDEPTAVGKEFIGWDNDVPESATSDLTFTAMFNDIMYSVEFVDEDDNPIDTFPAYYGDEVTLDDAEIPEGYREDCWTVAGQFVDFPYTITGDTVFKAAPGANRYTASFYVENELFDENEYVADAEITAPDDPTKEGYTFEIWRNLADDSIFNPGEVIRADVRYDAEFKINQYTISFDTDGGSDIADIRQDYGTAIEDVPVPSKEGYTFAGWDINIPTTMPAYDITATAQWTLNRYTITFDTDGGSDIASEVYGYEDTITVPSDPTKEGYTFVGWDPVIPATMPNQDVTVKAQWNINSYTVTWKADGQEDTTETYNYGDRIAVPADPQKTGYQFTGWDAVIPDTMPAEDLVFTAEFDRNTYKATFNADGGKFSDGASYVVVDTEYGEEIDVPEDPTREDYEFMGWSPVVPNGMPDEDIIFTAQWEYIGEVVYYINVYTVDPSTGEYICDTITKTADNNQVVEVVPTDNESLSEADIIINYESLTSSVSNVPDPDNSDNTLSATIVKGNSNVLNVYFKLDEFEVIFSTGEGEFADGSSEYSDNFTFGSVIEDVEEPTKEGYTFVGWYDDETGAKVELPYYVTDAISCTAQFVANTHKADFYVNDELVESIDVNYGDDVTAPNVTVPAGYELSEWTPALPSTMGDEDVEFRATLTAIDYTVTYILTSAPDGVTAPAAKTNNVGDEFVVDSAEAVAGYTFVGWKAENNATYEPGVSTFVMPANNVTFTGSYVANEYTISFNTDGGSYIPDATYRYGELVTSPANPNKDGYTFVGWDPALPSTMPAQDITVRAIWRPISPDIYNITYTYDGDVPENADQLPAQSSQEAGKTVNVAANPSDVEGYSFLGWYYNNRPVDSFVMPENDVTIVGMWAKKSYTINFNTDGGNYIAPAAYDYGENVVAPAEPTREGYEFVGWDPELPNTMPAENITVTAQWRPVAPETYMVTYEYTGVIPVGAPDVPVDSTEYLAGDIVTVMAHPELSGYNFVGWTYNGGTFIEGATFVMPEENVTLKGEFKPATYTITFNTAGGSAVAPITQEYNTAVIAPENPTREGYEFAGWDPALPSTMPANDMTVTAKWDVKQYTITFDTDGGSNIAPATYDYGENVVAPAEPTKEGYEFVGWDPALPSTMPANDMTVTALWVESVAEKHTATWYGDDGNVITIDEYEVGEAIIPPDAPEVTGKNFVEWTPEVPETMGTEDLVFTAIYEDVEPETAIVTFNANGGAFPDGAETVEVDVVIGDESDKPEDPSREGFEFLGWSKDPNATEPETIDPITEDVTVYAVWKEIPAETYTVTYYTAADNQYDVQTYNEGDSIVPPEAPEADGWTFVGWVTGSQESEEPLPATMPAENINAYAKWELNSYKAEYISEGETVAEYNVLYGAAVPVPEDPTREGYIFAGWDPAVDATMPNHDVTYTAKWNEVPVESDEYVATYLVDGKTYASYNVKAGDSIPVPSDPEKFGFKFVGWDPEVPSTMPESDITFEAQWEIDKTTVAIIIGGVAVTGGVVAAIIGASNAAWITAVSVVGGIIVIWGVAELVKHTFTVTYYVDGEVYKTYKVIEGTKIPVPADPTKEGSEFTGWDPEVPERMPANDLEFNATWSAENNGSSDVDVEIPDTGSVAGITAFATISAAAALAYIYTRKKNKED